MSSRRNTRNDGMRKHSGTGNLHHSGRLLLGGSICGTSRKGYRLLRRSCSCSTVRPNRVCCCCCRTTTSTNTTIGSILFYNSSNGGFGGTPLAPQLHDLVFFCFSLLLEGRYVLPTRIVHVSNLSIGRQKAFLVLGFGKCTVQGHPKVLLVPLDQSIRDGQFRLDLGLAAVQNPRLAKVVYLLSVGFRLGGKGGGAVDLRHR
mmetsp:Transcript_20923/g.45552  ORF Transcript_20923/g.45552 Transcript_20923/m.45552 type:complete len:202 (-) Transcript_20923:406-1011(-)